MKKGKITHIDEKGDIHMVDIGDKADTLRKAEAFARVIVSKELLLKLTENKLTKGNALTTAKIAGIQAAKKTADLIPLCHPIPITNISLETDIIKERSAVEIKSTVQTYYKTGVEMEALTAVAVAALTIIDMGKSVDRNIVIESINLLSKSGGKSGKWQRKKEI
jgi:cyclic pyranopterin phosphate synthase